MQVPKRRSQMQRIYDPQDEIVHLTVGAIERLKRDLEDLEQRQKKQAIEDVSVALAKGDLSENAEYQEAKGRLGRIEGRIFSLKERLKKAIPIQAGADGSGRIGIGSTVKVQVNGKEKTYQIVGPQETNPTMGRISYLSPLGAALREHVAGDDVSLETDAGVMWYRILEVK